MTKKTWIWLLLFLVVSTVLVVCAFHFDSAVQQGIAQHQSRGAKGFMRNVSRYGDWPAHAALGLIGLGVAYWRGSKKWIRIFAAMLLAFAIVGVTGRVIKIATGRARPSVLAEMRWNGPRFASKYHAFPSGHTASSTAFFATLFFASWRIGLACAPVPALIAASRMYVGAHYLSDVVFAAILGILCALLAAHVLRIPERESAKA